MNYLLENKNKLIAGFISSLSLIAMYQLISVPVLITILFLILYSLVVYVAEIDYRVNILIAIFLIVLIIPVKLVELETLSNSIGTVVFMYLAYGLFQSFVNKG